MNLNVSTVNFLGATKASKSKQNHKEQTKQVSFVTTPDSFKKREFNLDNAVDTLSKMRVKKYGMELPKFEKGSLETIKNELFLEPKKWNSVYALAQKDHISGNTVTKLSREPLEKLNTIKLYADAENNKKSPRYSGNDLLLFVSNETTDELKKTLPLTKTSLSTKNVISLKRMEADFTKKAADKIVDMEHNVCKDEVKQIVFTRDKSDREAFNIIAQDKKNELHSALLNKKLDTEAVETASVYGTKQGKVYEIKKVKDLRNNTTSKVRMEADYSGYPVVTHEVRVHKDKNNKVTKTEYTAPSEIPGIFDIKYKYPNGKEEIVSSGKYDKKSGITSIKKNMVSLDGTRTDYLYENDENGNRISDYKITDKKGNVLLKKSSSFEVVNPHKFISSNNDDKYEILLDKDEKSIKVTDMKNPKRSVTIDVDKQIIGNKKKIMTSLKQMPGEELIKSTKKLVGIDSPLESYYQPGDKSIHSGDQLFVILHELGHARDMRDLDVSSDEGFYSTFHKTISSNPELNETFEEEKANFNKAFPDAQRDHIDYFVNTLNHYGGELGGFKEVIAEGNALLTTPKTMDLLAIRSQYLQQYFPRTIASLSNIVSQEKPFEETENKNQNVA